MTKFCNGPNGSPRPYATFEEAERNARRTFRLKGFGTVYTAPDRGRGVMLAEITKDAYDRVWTCLSNDGAKLV